MSEKNVTGFDYRYTVTRPEEYLQVKNLTEEEYRANYSEASLRQLAVFAQRALDDPRIAAEAEKISHVLCGDYPAPCNCDNPVTHTGRN